MENKDRIIILCAVIIIGLISFVAYNYIDNKKQEEINNITITYYNQGVFDGQLSIIQRIQTGEIPVLSTQGNETTLDWYPLNQICGGN